MTSKSDSSYISSDAPVSRPGPYLARVVSHLDPTYMGILEVEILRPTGNTSTAGQLHQVKYMSPFYGVTSIDYTSADPDDYNNTQKSYGMWMIPPDPGSTVVIIFIDGDPKRGYWIGCVQDESMNFMVPGLAATSNVVEKNKGRSPVGEYNKKVNFGSGDPTKFKKPVHPISNSLSTQGLILDDIRGITSSSARRETPSMVFGISTPGPLDKRTNAKRGYVGKKDHQVNGFVSRLGGSTFVMDDGDDKFLRKKPAGESPPEYAAVEMGENTGDRTIPHNELIRIRTRTGHQILMHNSEDLIYIGNSKGTTWIELTSNGKIDIFAEDSISIHTKNDLNVTADRDINFKAGGAINLTSGSATNISPSGDFNVNAANTSIDGGEIHLNSGKAKKCNVPGRVPQHEPWAGHENLDPASCVPGKTIAVKPDAKASATEPAFYKKYTTPTDTFNKVPGAKK